MGGKGIRRREKNYRAAHGGGNSRLPPPPDPSSVDALPSKLRTLMSFAGAAKKQSKKNSGGADKGGLLMEGTDSTATGVKRKRNDQTLMLHEEHGNEVPDISKSEKKKKKKKSKTANDLRFVAADKAAGAGSRRKDRKKELLEARKKKNKRQRAEGDLDFPGREEIKFGDVVEAPPKLVTVPKAFKVAQEASQERLRLQAVDAYRKRKGWESRPGVKLPPPVTTSQFL